MPRGSNAHRMALLQGHLHVIVEKHDVPSSLPLNEPTIANHSFFEGRFRDPGHIILLRIAIHISCSVDVVYDSGTSGSGRLLGNHQSASQSKR